MNEKIITSEKNYELTKSQNKLLKSIYQKSNNVLFLSDNHNSYNSTKSKEYRLETMFFGSNHNNTLTFISCDLRFQDIEKISDKIKLTIHYNNKNDFGQWEKRIMFDGFINPSLKEFKIIWNATTYLWIL